MYNNIIHVQKTASFAEGLIATRQWFEAMQHSAVNM
jgi:hypothetical protein